jgi:hypothetical protein
MEEKISKPGEFTEDVIKAALEHTKSEFKKYGSVPPKPSMDKIIGVSEKQCLDRSADEIIVDFQFELQKWAMEKYGDIEHAARMLRRSERCLKQWGGGK